MKKLDLTNSKDLSLIKTLLANRIETTKLFGAEKYNDITMWHLINVHSDNIFYIADEECILIMKLKNNELHIFDVVCKNNINIKNVISNIQEFKNVDNVTYYFPNDQLQFNYDKTIDADSGLFVFGDLHFSLNDFKFPETAIT